MPAMQRLAARLDAGLPEPIAGAWSAVRRRRAARRYAYPTDPDELRDSPLLRDSWYYGIELLPGVFTDGQQPAVLPMLPRMLLRNCDVAGRACLDVGSMEGLVPVLLRKRGAQVLAVDYSYAAAAKLAAVQHYHGVDFEFRAVGLMYEAARRLRSRSFDLVNLSGILYHVFSPLHLLGAIRPLMRRNGLLVVSTYVTLDPLPVMDFNARGRMWGEGNTFWFPSVALLDYLLRYLRLEPVDCRFRRLEDMGGEHYGGLRIRHSFEKPAGYVSVVCRAVDRAGGDAWMEESTTTSWEYRGVVDWELADSRGTSTIGYRGPEPEGGLDLHEAVVTRPPVAVAEDLRDSHVLTLDATD